MNNPSEISKKINIYLNQGSLLFNHIKSSNRSNSNNKKSIKTTKRKIKKNKK